MGKKYPKKFIFALKFQSSYGVIPAWPPAADTGNPHTRIPTTAWPRVVSSSISKKVKLEAKYHIQ